MDWFGPIPGMMKYHLEDLYNHLQDVIPDEWKSHPGDPGYWSPSDVNPEVDVLPYIPGISTLQEMADAQAYWKDYKKNTGFSPRYPGMAVHTPTVAQTQGSFDWWLP